MSRGGLVLARLPVIFRAAIEASEWPDTNVFLGPVVSGDPDTAVFVGYDGDPFGDMEAAVHAQQWGAIGVKAQDEQIDVRCCILARHGAASADDVADAIIRLYAMFAVLSRSIKADPSIGLGPPTTTRMTCSIRNLASYFPLTDDGGVEPRVSFNVHAETRV